MFCYTCTSAVHIDVTEDYSTDSFLLCLKRFFNLRGTPSRIVSDPETQLMGARDVVDQWDFSRIDKWVERNRIEWVRIPTASQHFNGNAEAMIKVTKKQLDEG